MADDPQIVQVDLLETNIISNPEPLPVVANASILAFLNTNLTPTVDWSWQEQGDLYTMTVDEVIIIRVNGRQFKNSVLADNDVARYQKIIDKRL